MKTRPSLRGLNRHYTQWNQIITDILDGRFKNDNNRKCPESESELEEGEEESDFENYDTLEQNGYKPVSVNVDDDKQIQTDGELNNNGNVLT